MSYNRFESVTRKWAYVFSNYQFYGILTDNTIYGWTELCVFHVSTRRGCHTLTRKSIGTIWFHWDGRIFLASSPETVHLADEALKFISKELAWSVKLSRAYKTVEEDSFEYCVTLGMLEDQVYSFFIPK